MKPIRTLASCMLACLLGLAALPCFAQATIDQNKALAGNVTPGDAPGYPITLSQPGSYRLTSNLSVPADTDGIVITAAGVTLDLNGFTLSGPVNCSRDNVSRAVTCSAPSSGKTGIRTAEGSVVRNGTVKGFNGVGLNVDGLGNLLERLSLAHNSSNGIATSGNGSHVRVVDCVAMLNGQTGATVLRAVVSGSGFSFNGLDGFGATIGTLLLDSQMIGNFRNGFNGATVSRTVSFSNGFNDVQGPLPLGVDMNQDGASTY